jgi:diamine N-acetyltransferase
MIRLVPLDRYNWELCLNIRLLPEQERFVPPVLYSLAQSRFENLIPFGIEYEEEMVGFLMYGNFSGLCWINRIIVDAAYQRQGIGQAAMRELLIQLQVRKGCKEIRTSYAAGNLGAAEFFAGLGFEPMAAALEDEVVAVLKQK